MINLIRTHRSVEVLRSDPVADEVTPVRGRNARSQDAVSQSATDNPYQFNIVNNNNKHFSHDCLGSFTVTM